MRGLERDLVVGRMQVEAIASEAEADHRPFARAPFLQAIGLRIEDALIELDRALDIAHRHRDMIDVDFHGNLLTIRAADRSIQPRPLAVLTTHFRRLKTRPRVRVAPRCETIPRADRARRETTACDTRCARAPRTAASGHAPSCATGRRHAPPSSADTRFR